MCDEAVDAFLVTLRFVPNWFVTKKMLQKLDNAVLFNDDIDLNNTMDSDIATVISDVTTLNTILLI